MIVAIDDLPQFLKVLRRAIDNAITGNTPHIQIRISALQRGGVNGLSLQAIDESGVVKLGHLYDSWQLLIRRCYNPLASFIFNRNLL